MPDHRYRPTPLLLAALLLLVAAACAPAAREFGRELGRGAGDAAGDAIRDRIVGDVDADGAPFTGIGLVQVQTLDTHPEVGGGSLSASARFLALASEPEEATGEEPEPPEEAVCSVFDERPFVDFDFIDVLIAQVADDAGVELDYLSAGDAGELRQDGGTILRLPAQPIGDGVRYTGQVDNAPALARGATISFPGDEFPAVQAVAVPFIAPATELTPTAGIAADTVFEWSPEGGSRASGLGLLLQERGGAGRFVACHADYHDGRFDLGEALGDGLGAELGPNFRADVQSVAVATADWRFSLSGLVLVTNQREVRFR